MKKRLTYRRLLLSLSTCGVFSLACTAYALTNADSSFYIGLHAAHWLQRVAL
ncbi:MAG: hypothetical protein HWD59_03510 [Coxiellaceae bacterium]|nr:MAG: hypothetical protein HWD59_03510 [Coxiellaceae bacterium]